MKYHKINAPFKRNMDSKRKELIMGDWVVEEFCFLKDVLWSCREKIDGTNIRAYFNGDSVRFEGRKDNSTIPDHLIKYLESEFTTERLKLAFPEIESEVVLYGEGCGFKIQKGDGLYSEKGKTNFILFDVFINGVFLDDNNLQDVANKLKMDIAPIVLTTTLDEIINTVNLGLRSEYYDGFAEGVVAKPSIQLLDRRGERIITKIKHKDFYN